MMFVPYIENTFAGVRWGPYEEICRLLPTKISRYKERCTERSVGLRQQWISSDNTIKLQTWIAKVSEKYTKQDIVSLPLHRSVLMYQMSIPAQKKKQLLSECGIIYRKKIAETAYITFNNTFRLNKAYKVVNHMANVLLQCIY